VACDLTDVFTGIAVGSRESSEENFIDYLPSFVENATQSSCAWRCGTGFS
jgi:hypothetical protein